MAEQTTRIAFSTSGILGKVQILVVCEGRKSCPDPDAVSKTSFTCNRTDPWGK